MKTEEKTRLTYLDSVLRAIKDLGGDRVSLMDILQQMDDKRPKKIVSKLVYTDSSLLEKAVILLIKWGYLDEVKDTNAGTSNRNVSITFEGELIHAQGGLLAMREAEYTEYKLRTKFHRMSPWISVVSAVIALISLGVAIFK